MGAELVGGALLSAFLQVAFDRLASPQFLDFFHGRKLDEKLLGKLNIMLHSINALADDAELRQFTDPNVKAWLFAVKEAVFDAEDLLDEIDYELTRCQVEAQFEPQTFTYKVSNFFNSTFSSFNKKIESGMKEVLEKLEYLANQKGALGLKEGTYFGGDGSGSKVSHKLQSTFLVVESVIYGRDADKDIIITWLTSETDNPNQPSILSILGMGGLGKTTLAQHVYNDPKIDDAKFDIKAWVCVFANHALKDGDHELNDELKEIGRRIVEKCNGLPLALKTIGCLLRTMSSISDWKNILESDIWELPNENNEIIPALFLSYRYLPSHLKRCFTYCALFPKDYEFVKEELILLWMAQNFLQSPQHIRHQEEKKLVNSTSMIYCQSLSFNTQVSRSVLSNHMLGGVSSCMTF